MTPTISIREIRNDESALLGQLMIDVYSRLEGFPTPAEQPGYDDLLATIGRLTEKKVAKVLVAIEPGGRMVGGVVYFDDLAAYGSGGKSTTARNASAMRLLGVSAKFRGRGTGQALTNACIRLAKGQGHSQIILHTTRTMQFDGGLYESLGFARSTDLDFMQGALPVFGYKLRLHAHK